MQIDGTPKDSTTVPSKNVAAIAAKAVRGSHPSASIFEVRRCDKRPNDRRLAIPLPTLTPAQVAWIVQQVVAYIGYQRETYRPAAAPLSLVHKAAMRSFFPGPALDSSGMVALARQRVTNPPFYRELIKMGFEVASLPDFEHMAAITFVDTVVSHEPFTDRLLFHELVHIVQYEKLGLPEFADKYVRGFLSGGSYEAIPLEMNAYELDARFAAAPARAFSVDLEVEAWMRAGRF